MNENITSQATANLLDIDTAKQVTSLIPLVGWKRALDFVNQSHQQKLDTDVVLVFLLLTLNRFYTLFWCFHDVFQILLLVLSKFERIDYFASPETIRTPIFDDFKGVINKFGEDPFSK